MESQQLMHDAELLLRFYDDPEGMRAYLQRIDQELETAGVSHDTLHRAIEQLCGDDRREHFRCAYHPELLVD